MARPRKGQETGRTINLTVRVSPEERDRLAAAAKCEDSTMAGIIHDALEQYFAKRRRTEVTE